MLKKFAAILAMCLSLSACETLPWARNDGCIAIYRATADSIVIKGVSFPINALGTLNFKLGELTVTPQELSAVTEAVRMAQESRLRQCNVLAEMRRATPPATAAQIRDLYATFYDADHATNLLIAVLSDGARKNELQIATQALQNAATSEGKKFNSVPISQNSILSISAELRKEIHDYSSRLLRIEKTNEDLKSQMAALTLPRAEFRQVLVKGFPPGGIVLRPEMRRRLEGELNAVLSNRTGNAPIAVSITGYADATGSALQNLSVGMQRASAVASHIHLVFADRVNIRSISSGGVRLKDPDARRVEVTVSGSFVIFQRVAA